MIARADRLVHAEAREEQTVTTGTKAWELFKESPEVIAARVGDGDEAALRDLAHELADGEQRAPRLARRRVHPRPPSRRGLAGLVLPQPTFAPSAA